MTYLFAFALVTNAVLASLVGVPDILGYSLTGLVCVGAALVETYYICK